MRRLPIIAPIKEPCDADWDVMEGDAYVRHCRRCERPVRDLSALREVEAQAHVMVFGGAGLCVRYAHDGSGTILHAPQRRGLGQPLAAGLLVAALSLAGEGTARAEQAATAPAAAAAQAQGTAGVLPNSGDADGDGIADAVDACPNIAGRPAAEPAKNGCPSPTVVVKELGGTHATMFVQFARGSSKPVAAAAGLLTEVATVLNTHSGIRKLAIEGHATPDEPNAKALSEARAKAVVAALVAAKVAPERLIVTPYGAERPLNMNKTKEDREHNRRVSFFIVERTD